MHAWHDTLHDLHLGTCSASEAALRLYGHADEQLVARLDTYRRGFVSGEANGLATQHPQCHGVVCELSGAERWSELAVAFLADHPRMHARRTVSLAPFADWLRGRDDVPAWLADLALLERASVEAEIAADEREGLLGAGTSITAVEHDVLVWHEAGDDVRYPPAPGTLLVLTWRDAHLEVRQAEIGELEQFVVEALRRGGQPSDAELAAVELSREEFAEIVEQLADLGVT
jgi:hypothetical protein